MVMELAEIIQKNLYLSKNKRISFLKAVRKEIKKPKNKTNFFLLS